MQVTLISALAADPITFENICEIESMGLLRRGRLVGGVVMSGCLSTRN